MFKEIGLLFNAQKKEAIQLAKELISWGKSQNISFLVPLHEASVLDIHGLDDNTWKNQVKIAIVIGGDGTFLRAARYIYGYDILLYGINVGRLGFLACGNPYNAKEEIKRILKSDFLVQNRMTLQASVCSKGKIKHKLYALNEFAVTKGAFARIIYIKLDVNKRHLATYPADGIILSTPTGSTAYSLSAGGPVVPPHLKLIIAAPICAHTLYARPIILSDKDKITISVKSDHRDIMLTQDGQLGYELLPDDKVEIEKSDHYIKTIYFKEKDFYTLLKEKLQWGNTCILET